MAINLLTLDQSYPVADSYHDTNQIGTIRWIDDTDSFGLDSMNRLQGDLFHRFSLVEGKVNEVISNVNSDPTRGSFDNRPYTLTDGSHPFTSPIQGQDPVVDAHLATKGYSDALVGGFQAVLDATTLALQEIEQVIPDFAVSDWVEHEGNDPGTRVEQTFTLAPGNLDLDSVLGVHLIERLDIAQPTEVVPNPDPEYVYRLIGSSNYGFEVLDFWATSSSTVTAVLANNTTLPENLTGDHLLLSNPRTRFLKAVVFLGTPQAELSSATTYKSGREAIADATDEVDVLFQEAFVSTPTRVELTLLAPSGTATVLSCAIDKTSLISTGFTAHLSAATSEEGYELQWAAFL